AGESMLEDFLGFSDLSMTDAVEPILRYARQWGTLDLCSQHRLPLSHNPPLVDAFFAAEACFPIGEKPGNQPARRICTGLESGVGPRLDPITEWLRYSRMLRAALQLSIDLDAGRLTTVEDWRKVLTSGQQVADTPTWRLDSAGKKRSAAQVAA